MREKLEEKIFDVQLRNPSGGNKPGNAGVKGSTVGCIGGALPGLCFLMVNILRHKHSRSPNKQNRNGTCLARRMLLAAVMLYKGPSLWNFLPGA
jgi:hypothetical protein